MSFNAASSFSDSTWFRAPVFQLFKTVVDAFPNKVAVKDNSQSLTYQEVYENAVLLAGNLIDGSENEPVAIALENTCMFPVAMLACLAVGRPYVGLDLSMPTERNEFILKLSGATTVIYDTENPFSTTDKSKSVNIRDLQRSGLANLQGREDSIAYIIYTSGSTGEPKGVYQNQQGLLHDVWQYIHAINIGSEDRLTLLYSPSVNGAIRDIYGALLSGATLYMYDLRKNGFSKLEDFVSSNGITVFHSIPNIFRTFLAQRPSKKSLEHVRLIYLAGDRIFNSDIELYRVFFKDFCRVYVGIGATEVATIYHQWLIDKTTDLKWQQLPVGYAVADRQTTILREDGTPAEAGELGEIAVTSKYVALGYWKDAVLTDTKFKARGDNRSYHTGDLGMIDQWGMLHYVGRNDGMVKKDGHRIETGEIESVIMQLDEVEKCGVVLTSDSQQKLVAIVQTTAAVSEQSMKERIKTRLPSHMIPFCIIGVEQFPLSANFKTDYSELRRLAAEFLNTQDHEDSRPNNPVQQVIFDSWSKILGSKSFLENRTWKDAGGSSMEAVNFMVEVEIALNVRFEEDWIRDGAFTAAQILLRLNGLQVLTKVDKPRLYYFPPLYGLNERVRKLIHTLSKDLDVVIINYPNLNLTLLENPDWKVFEEKVAAQISHPAHASFGLLGNCSGGKILYSLLLTGAPYNQSGFIGIIDGSIRAYKSTESKQRFSKWMEIKQIPTKISWKIFRKFPSMRGYMKHVIGENQHARFIVKGLINALATSKLARFDGHIHFFANEDALSRGRDGVNSISESLNVVPLTGDHALSMSDANINIIAKEVKAHVKGAS